MVHAPCRAKLKVLALCAIGVLTLQKRKGERLGAGAANGRRGEEKEKVCYVQCCGGDLQPLTLTNSTQFLQALKGRPSIGHLSSPSDSEREDLQRMLEIFLGRSTIRFVVEPLRLARSLKLVVASGLLVPRGTRVPPTTDRDRCTQQCRTANSLYWRAPNTTLLRTSAVSTGW